MNKKPVSSHGSRAQRESARAPWRAGMARKQLITVIICSIALVAAVVSLVHFFMSDPNKAPGDWQCPSCDYDFSKNIMETPPIYCPRCDDQAARLFYHNCPKCKEKNVVSRVRITEEGEAALVEHGGPGSGYMPSSEMQYRIKQDDGSYDWTDWSSTIFSRIQELDSYLVCTECDTNLYGIFPTP